MFESSNLEYIRDVDPIVLLTNHHSHFIDMDWNVLTGVIMRGLMSVEVISASKSLTIS
jgi:hypothetical protein